MADANNEPEVKDVERVEVAPSGEGETIVPETETQPQSSEAEIPEGEPEVPETDPETGKPETIVTKKPATQTPEVNLAEVPGETPRERALRLEVTRLKGERRGEQTKELLGQPAPTAPAKKELSPEKKKILERFKPEELAQFEQVMDVMAEQMGFVRADQLGASTFADKASEELDTFLGKHPEYVPENDKDGVLWERFKSEFSLYKQPQNPRDYRKIFEKVHKEVFGIKPAAALPNNSAEQRKTQVASHAGASTTTTPRAQKAGNTDLRLDMLKGFSPEELKEFED